MATKIYRVTRSTGSKLDEARLAAIGRALGVKPSAEPVERLRLGWAAYVDTIASKDDLKAALERKLPDDYLAWRALHDGGEGDLGGGPFPWGVLSLARSAQAMHRQKDLAKMMKGYRVEDDDERVRPVFWDKGWFPSSDSGGGDYKCLDVAPTKAGVKG